MEQQVKWNNWQTNEELDTESTRERARESEREIERIDRGWQLG